ncbi:hypothetical protein LEMLEM_LOCUS3655 [Lemmus lemmus]
MEKAGRGGTKFSLANGKTVFAGGALALAPRQRVGAARFPPSLTSTPGFLGLLAPRSLPFAGSGYKGSEEILNTVIPLPAQPFKFPTRGDLRHIQVRLNTHPAGQERSFLSAARPNARTSGLRNQSPRSASVLGK